MVIKISEVGIFWGYEVAEQINFFSNDYFIDSSIIFVRLSALQSQLDDLIDSNGRIITEKNVHTVDFWIRRKKEQVKEFYDHGGAVVLILDSMPIVPYRIEEYMSTRSYQVDLVQIFMYENNYIDYEPNSGNQYIVDKSLKKLPEFFNISFYFIFKFIPEEAKILFTTVKSKNILSFSVKLGNGLLMTLPTLYSKEESNESDNNLILRNFLDIIDTQKNSADFILENIPTWIDQVSFLKEKAQEAILNELYSQKETLSKKINDTERTLSEYLIIKSIIFTKGSELEFGVMKCLEYLGINFEIPKGSETDLIIIENDEYFPIEVKGGVGSATKQHTRQLEDWVNSCASKYNVEDPKGILIINTFCDVPVDERTQLDFPPNVVEYSKSRSHCLLTAKTFLNIISDFDDGKIDKTNILKLLKSTSGVLSYKNDAK